MSEGTRFAMILTKLIETKSVQIAQRNKKFRSQNTYLVYIIAQTLMSYTLRETTDIKVFGELM